MRKDDIRALAAVIGFYFIIELLGVTCPIRFLTGISCAGCGMSRAWLSLLRLDLSAAFAYHPLFWVPALALICWLLRKKLPKSLYKGILIACCAALLAVYVVRLIDPTDSIVVIQPKTGLLFRIAEAVFRLVTQH